MSLDCFTQHAKLFSKEEMADLLAKIQAKGGDKVGVVRDELTKAHADLQEVTDAILKVIQPKSEESKSNEVELARIAAADRKSEREAKAAETARQDKKEAESRASDEAQAASAETETIMARARKRMVKADPEVLEAKPTVEDWLTPEEKRRIEKLQTGAASLTDKQIAARARAAKRGEARKQVDVNHDSITEATIKLGGIALRHRSEMLKDAENPQVPFVGWLFNKTGRGPDELTDTLHGMGYLSAEEMKDHGGVPALTDYLTAEAKGAEPHLSDRRDANIQDDELERMRDIAAQEAEQMTPEQGADAAGDESPDWHTISPEEQNAQLNTLYGSDSEEAAGVAEEGARTDEGEMGPGEREPGQDDEESPGFSLEQQTPEDLAAKAKAEQDAADAERKATADKEETERAAREKEEVRRRSEAAAKDFQLGQDAAANLSGQKPLFSRGDTFYSALGRAVDAANMKAAPTEGWRAFVKGLVTRGAIKQAEVDATGLDDWLNLRDGKVSKEEVQAFLKDHGVKVEEVQLGGEGTRDVPAALAALRADDNLGFDTPQEALQAIRSDHATIGDRVFDNWEMSSATRKALMDYVYGKPGSTPKFGAYQLPGGMNYKELLLTLPEGSGSPKQREWRRMLNKLNEHGLQEPGEYERFEKLGAELGMSGRGSEFRSTHFDEPNILAHVRFNERTDADGKRVLFLEELQSDWAQKGKKSGFRVTPEREAQLRANIAEIEKIGKDATPEQKQQWVDAMNELQPESMQNKPPSGPFVGKTDGWVSLALKRMIRYAAENGFDRVAWANGEQQAARYDLSKQVNRILIHARTDAATGERTRQVSIDLNSGPTIKVGIDKNGVVDNHSSGPGDFKGKPLSDVVGKELADRIMGLDMSAIGGHQISGEGLKIGGEGMRAFYDKIVPNVANDVLKKLGGGKVGEVGLETSGTRDAYVIEKLAEDKWVVRDKNTLLRAEGTRSFDSAVEAEKWIADNKKTTPQPGFDITMAMRDKVMAGQPLFRRSPRSPASPIRDALAPALDKLTIPATVHDSIDQARALTGIDIPDDARGMYSKGAIHLFGENLNPLTAEQTLWHEVNHAGLDRLYGTGSRDYEDALTRIAGQNRNIMGAAAEWRAKYGDDALQQAKTYGMDDARAQRYVTLQSYDEALSDLGAKNAQIGGLKPFLATVQKFMRSIGLSRLADAMEGKTDAEALALVAKARNAVTKDGNLILGGVQPAFSRGKAIAGELKTMPDWVKAMDPKAQEALRKAGIWTPKQTLSQRWAAQKNEMGQKILQGTLDQFAPVLKKIGDYPYKLLRMASSADAGLEASLEYGRLKLNDAGALETVKGTKGFLDIMKPLQGEADRFLAWVAGNRAEGLSAEDREHLFGSADIAELKRLNTKTHAKDNFANGADGSTRPEVYTQVLKDYNDFSKSILDIAEKTGIIDGEKRALWEKEFYVPFYRDAEDRPTGPGNLSGMVNQYAFKKLKGGEEPLKDLLANTMQNWSHLLNASLKNQAAKVTLEGAEKLGIAERVKSDEKGSVYVLENGEKVHYVVHDPLVLDAVSSLDAAPFKGPIMKALGEMKKILTVGTTASPVFRLRHTIREQITAMAANPTGYNFVRNWVDGFKYSSRDNPQYGNMLAGGGFFRMGMSLQDKNAEYVKRLIAHGVDASTVLDTPAKVQQALKGAWDWWKETGERSDSITRANIYRQVYAAQLAKGESPDRAHFEAAYAARDVMDYGLRGTWPALRMITQAVPFMNARMQGLYKLGRGAAADPKRFSAVVGGITLATIALSLAYRNDPDFQAREEFDRNNNWWFKIGDKAFRVPKPFEVGAIATIADRALETALNGFDPESRERFATQLAVIAGSQLNLNPIPQAVWPIAQLWANKDEFTGRQIESTHDQTLSTANRAGPSTTATARLLGKAGVLSPDQIDFLVKAYFGWVGAHVVATSDLALRPMMGLPSQPAARTDDYFAVGDFVKDLPSAQSRFVEQFYDHLKDTQTAMDDMRNYQRQGQAEAAQEAFKSANVQLAGVYRNAMTAIGQINTQVHQIQNGNMDPDQKRASLDNLYQLRNAIAQRVEERRNAALQ